MKQQMPSFLGTCCCSCVPRHAHQPLGLSSSYGSWITGGHWREVSWSSAHTNRIGVCTSARSLTCRRMVWSSFPTFSLGKELLLPSAHRCLTGTASFFQSAERNEKFHGGQSQRMMAWVSETPFNKALFFFGREDLSEASESHFVGWEMISFTLVSQNSTPLNQHGNGRSTILMVFFRNMVIFGAMLVY